jgi:tetratricopeptide (TPR) repeat protein
MKQFFILIAVIFATVSLSAQDILQQANEAYSKNDFTEALNLYEQALKENGESAAVYYNIGNCYYKLNKVGPSILNYERAHLLDPGNKDIRFNLEIARLKTVDKIEPVGDFFLTEWFLSVQNLLSTDDWSYFSIVCFILLIAGLFLFFFSRRIFIKKLGFYAGIGLLVLVIFGNIFASNQKRKLTRRNTAVIFVQTTTIKSSPDNSGTELFILHEGTKVELKSKLGNWNEIETAAGNVGWIKSEEIEVI